MAKDTGLAPTLRDYILDEVAKAFGFSDRGLARSLLGAIFYYAANRFALLAAEIDQSVAESDLQTASGGLLRGFAKTVIVRGQENIPSEGPVLIACNHPGAFDSVAMAAKVPRNDIKMVVSGVPFLESLPNLTPYLIYAPGDTHERMKALRAVIRQLKVGGAVVIFASGRVDPDPQVLPGAKEALMDWSPSLEIILRRAPETQLLPVIISGVLSPASLRIPIIRFQKEAWKQRRLAEYFQVVGQLLFPKRFRFRPRISFGMPLTLADLTNSVDGTTRRRRGEAQSDIMRAIYEHAAQLLDRHQDYEPFSDMD